MFINLLYINTHLWKKSTIEQWFYPTTGDPAATHSNHSVSNIRKNQWTLFLAAIVSRELTFPLANNFTYLGAFAEVYVPV